MQEIWEENRAAMPALAAAATIGALHIRLSGPGAGRAVARGGSGLPAFSHAAPSPRRSRRLSDATGRGAQQLRGGDAVGGASFIVEDDDGEAAQDDVHGGSVDEDWAGDAVIHLPLAPGVHNVTIEAPGAMPVVRVVEIPHDGSGAQLQVKLKADPQEAADHGQQVEDWFRQSSAVGGGGAGTGFPYRILRGRGAVAVAVGAEDVGVAADEQTGPQRADTGGNGDGRGGGANGNASLRGGDAATTLGTGSHSSFSNRMNEAVVGMMTEGHVPPGEGASAAAGGQAKRAGGGKGVGGMAVVADQPHSVWWRCLRGGLAVAGAAFIVVQIMRLKGRPVGLSHGGPDGGGWGAVGAPGPRVTRRAGQTIALGHHSFHQRPTAMV